MPLALDKKLDKAFGRRGLALTLKRLSKLALNRFSETNIVEISSSMTLATVLSIVPLLAVALAMFSVIPAFAVYRKELELILANVIPGQYSIQIFHYLRGFSEHARGLSAFGFAGVALSRISRVSRSRGSQEASFSGDSIRSPSSFRRWVTARCSMRFPTAA